MLYSGILSAFSVKASDFRTACIYIFLFRLSRPNGTIVLAGGWHASVPRAAHKFLEECGYMGWIDIHRWYINSAVVIAKALECARVQVRRPGMQRLEQFMWTPPPLRVSCGRCCWWSHPGRRWCAVTDPVGNFGIWIGDCLLVSGHAVGDWVQVCFFVTCPSARRIDRSHRRSHGHEERGGSKARRFGPDDHGIDVDHHRPCSGFFPRPRKQPALATTTRLGTGDVCGRNHGCHNPQALRFCGPRFCCRGVFSLLCRVAFLVTLVFAGASINDSGAT